MSDPEVRTSFWDHLDVLRAALIRALTVVVVATVVAFCFKTILFDIILAPTKPGFITYRLINSAATLWDISLPPFETSLINTGVAQQLMIHITAAVAAGVIIASPYILFEIFRFVTPALYDSERRNFRAVVTGGYILFMTGVLMSYFILFPFAYRFLTSYQVSPEVTNLITLESYIDALTTLTLCIGLVFELPILVWLFAKLGFVTPQFLRDKRKHAIVAILILAAIITPTDVFTMIIVALPMWLLYEFSIYLISR